MAWVWASRGGGARRRGWERPNADVTIDGRARGRTPIDLELPAGKHDLVLHNPDTGQLRSSTIAIERDKTLSIIRW